MNLLEPRFSLTAYLGKANPIKSEFFREITFALLIKLTLLFGLWYLFFAGQKHPVDNHLMAAKLLGAEDAVSQSVNNQEHLK